MKTLCAIPLIMTLLIVLIICIMVVIRFDNRAKFLKTGELTFGEDAFQKDCEIKNHGRTSLIGACFTLNIEDPTQLKDQIDYIAHETQNFTLDYFKRYPKIYNKIKNRILYKENTLDNIYNNIENNFDVYPLLVIYSYPMSKVLVIMDHTYIGGYFFQEWGTVIFKGEKIKPYNLDYKMGLTELNSIRFLLMDILPKKIKSIPDMNLFQNRKEIIRVGIQYNIKNLQEEYGVKPKICLMYKFARIMFNNMKLKKEINILIPIAFKNNAYSYNNVGAILFTIYKNDTPKDITKRLEKKIYHSMATNHLMQIMNKGKEARSIMDAVFTIGFIKNPQHPTSDVMERIEVSYVDISFYGTYFASFTYGDIAHVSITIMTYDFDVDNFLNEEKDSYRIYCNN